MTITAPPLSGPLRIDFIDLDDVGAIGMTHCPGRSGIDPRGRAWQRDLAADVQAIREAGVDTVLSLLGDEELAALGAAGLGEHLRQAGIGWLQCPIADFGVPDAELLQRWPAVQAGLMQRLAADARILMHCAARLGRTGTMVGVLLRALGSDGESAIERVRRARPGTIETPAQAAFVRAFGGGMPGR